jgi:DNA-directed RNA polymerase subunit RPC12/RpoP
MTCKGICIRHKVHKPIHSGRYAMGQKRCQICELFIRWDGLSCPCCGYKLRTKPRNLKYKAKLKAREEIKEDKILLSVQHMQKAVQK